ncbi:MAG: OPT/YSL family transporter [Archangiaceae bacterium]|nr:OPT/YSL family transporter [Archangiaceae bacterium]
MHSARSVRHAAREPKSGFDIHLTEIQSFLWLTFAGLLGVLLAVPLRQHYIVDEKLTFADGVAAGETLIVLDSKGEEGRKAAKVMGLGTILSGLHFALRDEGLILKGLLKRFAGVEWALPDSLDVPNKVLAKTGTGLSWSLLALGSGALVGPRINASMMLGATLSWVVAPLALLPLGWIIDPNTGVSMNADNFKRLHVLFWVMWPGVGILIAGGLTALVLKWQVLMRSFKALTGAKSETGDLPLRVIVIGVVLSSVGLIVVQYINLGIPPWLTLLAILFSLPLMLIGLRALGETNWGPISTLANVMQGVFAAIVPGNLPANMVSSGTTGTIATDSEAIMQDYKAGHMIGSTPGKLTIMQLVGVPIGAAAVAWMYPFLAKTYGIVGEHAKLASPASARWAGFAVILKEGAKALPPNAVTALVIFALLGVVFTVLEGNKAIRKWVPSPTGVGIGMLVPFAVVSMMFVGGLLGYAWEKKDKKSSDAYSAPLASGLIAGEAIVAVIVPLLIAIGVIPND